MLQLHEYLLKLSVSLAVVFLFYHFVLRKLTFYSWNRWYLLGYTFLSFFIAAINITPLLQQNQLADNKAIQWVPSLDLYSQNAQVNDAVTTVSGQWGVWDWAVFILMAGTIILFARLFIQYLSFLRIRSRAKLLSDNGMRIYQVEGDIIPFSFGNSIFINQKLHTEEELQEIIRHEFVHVKQRHSLDILWSEMICILNWYNPFAWFLRHAIRQNLEFIADNKVVSNGVDRKQYQYLLLKVIGNNHFSIAPKFNFSSLKKRIAMMNKMKSAGVHIVKFLFILPLIAVLLVAFRNNRNDQSTQNDFIERSISTPGLMQAARIDTVPAVTTPNSKGYLIDVIGVNGECTVVVKDQKGKEVERVTLNKWKEEKKYGEQYGEILSPPTPPATAVAPLSPLSPLSTTTPLPPMSPAMPIECPVNTTTPVAMAHSGINLSGISREYEITDKKATLKLLDGTIENYDLTNKKEKDAFEKKYGKIININANVNGNVATTINGNINATISSPVNTVITIPTPMPGGSNPLTSTFAPAAISHGGVTSIATTTPLPPGQVTVADPYGHIITGKEDIVITITSKTSRQELDKFIADMKAKGVELDFDDIEYNEKGKLVNISGNMRSGGSHSNFTANDFDKLILAMVKKGDQVWFKVSVKDKEVI